MGDSNVTSNMTGAPDVTFTASKMVATTGEFDTLGVDTLNVNNLSATTVDLGDTGVDSLTVATGKVILGGILTVEASIVAAATALSGAAGSLYVGAGSLWILDGDTTATKIAIT